MAAWKLVSNAQINCCLHRNMPKACPYVMIRFLFVLSVNLNSKYWFFAEGEMFFYVFVSVPPVFFH